MDARKIFSENFKYFFNHSGMNKQEFVRRCRITSRDFDEIWDGKKYPDKLVQRRISEVFMVDLALLKEEPNKSVPTNICFLYKMNKDLGEYETRCLLYDLLFPHARNVHDPENVDIEQLICEKCGIEYYYLTGYGKPESVEYKEAIAKIADLFTVETTDILLPNKLSWISPSLDTFSTDKLIDLLVEIENEGQITKLERFCLDHIRSISIEGRIVPHTISLLHNLKGLSYSFSDEKIIYKDLSPGVSSQLKRKMLPTPQDIKEFTWLAELINSAKESLKSIRIFSGDLQRIPECIRNCKNLEILQLNKCKLEAIPDWISELTHLHSMILSGNHIENLNETLCSLLELEEIDISNNPISILPEWLGTVPVLSKLNLSNLRLMRIPYSLVKKELLFLDNSNYSKWKSEGGFSDIGSGFFNYYYGDRIGIYLEGTTLSEQDISMFLSNDRELIENWYQSNQANATIELSEAKVIFLGDGDVGKTYSIRRILFDGLQETDSNREKFHTDMTHGIIIKDVNVERDDNSEINLRFWDFGGQTIMHSMHRCFLTNDTCYVVVISTRNDREQMEEARYWLRNIQAFAEQSPVILYINRWSKMSDRLDIKRLKEEFPGMIRDVVYLNAKESSREEFLSLRDAIVKTAGELDCFGRKIPVTWNNIRKEITRLAREEKKFYLSREEYNEICVNNNLIIKGENDSRQLYLQLLSLFNTLGICFSYHELNNIEITDYKVLNPEWLTNAIYILIMSGGEMAYNGLLRKKSIEMLLKHPKDGESRDLQFMQGVEYSPEECQYVREVMRKFQLCAKIRALILTGAKPVYIRFNQPIVASLA